MTSILSIYLNHIYLNFMNLVEQFHIQIKITVTMLHLLRNNV